MLVTTDCGKVTISGEVEETKTFSIAATPHAYSILSSGIYSNKIRAVIRELSTNAYDAHVFSNKINIPFDVVLPGKFNPTFTIRDYGPGMSEEDIMNLYTTYFQSGSYKIKSNDFVGCLGLGSKSPFAYTRSFSVTSYYKGKKTNYALYIGSNGVPNITNMGSEDTLEESGLLISIPVNSSDFYNFCHEAQNVYKYFKIKPNVSGCSSYSLEELRYIYESKSGKWKIKGWDSDIQIIMGNICYPLSVSSLNKESKFLSSIRGLEIFVDIGSVNITPSREHLQYDKKTINYVLNAVEDITNEIKQQTELEISSCKSLWEARKKKHYLCNVNKGFSNIIHTLDLKWNNKILNDYINLSLEDIKDSYIFYEKTRRYKIRALQKPLQNVECSSKAILVVDDLYPKKGSYSRCLKYVRDTHSIVYLFNKVNKELIDKLGCLPEEIIKVSSLPKPQRSKSDSSVKYASKAKFFKYKNSFSNADYTHWFESEVDLNQGGFYVELERYLPIDPSNGLSKRNWYNFEIIVKALQKYNKDFCLYGVRASTIKKLKKDNKWVNLYDYVKSIVSIKNNKEFLQDFYNNEEYWNCKDEIIDKLFCFPNDFIQNNVLFTELQNAKNELYKSVKVVEQQSISLDQWKILFNLIGITLPILEPQYTLSELWNNIEEKYFMIKYITTHYDGITNQNVKDIMKYINQVEGK